MEYIILISIILICIFCVVSFLFYRKKENAKIFDKLEVIEKDVDADARFILSALYKDGHSELVTKEILTEEKLIQVSVKFLEDIQNKSNK